MTPSLKVLAPGLLTTVQDLGRFGYQNIGVPVSGALDSVSFRLANALVSNPQGMAALEILVSGPSFEIAADRVRIALVGAGCGLCIPSSGKPRVVVAGQSLTLGRGEVFRVDVGRQSGCCYLAVEGGIAVPLVLGSAATYLRAGLGGFNGRALQRGDVLPLSVGLAPERDEVRLPAPPPAGGQPIRIILGPQREYFSEAAVSALLRAEFRISKDADRMGMRLEGPLLSHHSGWDIVSDAIVTGSIQVPGSGQPIVLLADHQTTGGYPKIATVVSADLPALGRCRPGDPLRFVSVEVEAAEAICREEEERLAQLAAALEPVPKDSGLDLASLYTGNLISGVTTGRE